MNLKIDKKNLASICLEHHIKKLSLFGSILRNDFKPNSDIDVLVEFESGKSPGFIKLFSIEEALSKFFEGRKVDLVTPKFLNPEIRKIVLTTAQVQYAKK